MKRVTCHAKPGITLVLLLLLIVSPLQAIAVTAVVTNSYQLSEKPKLIITELQTNGGAAAQEFVELYNATSEPIDLDTTDGTTKRGWYLQFYSAADIADGNPDWESAPDKSIALTGSVPAKEHFVVSSTGYNPDNVAAQQTYAPFLTDTGGGLQLVYIDGLTTTIYDQIMWKEVKTGQDLPDGVLPSPEKAGSLQRMTIRPDQEVTYFNDEDVVTDFIREAAISPKAMWLPSVPVELPDIAVPEPLPVAEEEQTDPGLPVEPPVTNVDLKPPIITELLPNPASPQADESDEYIELYNPNESAFNLNGYTLEVGTTTLYDFTFTEDFTISPLGYATFYSRDTDLTLSNSGGQSKLLNPAGEVIGETAVYGTAAGGVAWTLKDDSWQWSTTLTPGLENIFTAVTAAVKTTATKKPTVKKATAKSTAAKVKGVSTAKAKTTKAKKAPKPKVATVAQTTEKTPRAPIQTGILVGVVAAAVLYAAYEYRSDISNRLYKLRQHRTVRILSRKQT